MSTQRSKSALDRFWEKVDVRAPDECWPWTAGTQRAGYGAFSFRHGTTNTASRVAWELHHCQPVPDGMWVLHHCDNPPCVNPAHLYIGTRVDNVNDLMVRRRHWAHRGDPGLKGESNGRAKLTEDDVREIRETYATGGASQPELGRLYGVTHAVIGNVIRRDSWKHVE